jgi:D-alanyl-D-alanine dipeptidase
MAPRLEHEQATWQLIPIDECGEPLREVPSEHRILVDPMYERLGYDEALGVIYLREGVVERLRTAAHALPDGYALLIWDGWRPFELQTRIYHAYRDEIMRDSSLRGAELQRRVEAFVSVPSIQSDRPSPHLTGGAVDLSLADAGGRPLDMGGEFDELTDRSRTNFYEQSTEVLARSFQKRRRLLVDAMTAAGFTNFASEWWHFDYGDQFWAHGTGQTARYGLASPPRPNGEP